MTSRRRLSKGKPAIWGPGSPPLPSPQRPPTPHHQAPGRPVCPPWLVLVAPCAAARPGPGQTAFTLLSDGVPQPVASPRLRGRGEGGVRRQWPCRLLTLPGNRRGAAGQRRPTVPSLKGPGTLYWIHLGPRRGTEALLGEGRVAPQVSGRFRGLETGLCPLGVEKEEYDAGAVDIWTKVFEMLV